MNWFRHIISFNHFICLTRFITCFHFHRFFFQIWLHFQRFIYHHHLHRFIYHHFYRLFYRFFKKSFHRFFKKSFHRFFKKSFHRFFQKFLRHFFQKFRFFFKKIFFRVFYLFNLVSNIYDIAVRCRWKEISTIWFTNILIDKCRDNLIDLNHWK